MRQLSERKKTWSDHFSHAAASSSAVGEVFFSTCLLSCLAVVFGQSAGFAAPAGSTEEPARPNVVLIVADDLGWSDLACYGSDLHETPHIDRLASQGVLFSNAYSASPVCSPTRASILTGRHPARLKMTIWREAALERGNRRMLEPIVRDQLPLSEITLAEKLHSAGYYTAHVGKWHLGRAGAYPQTQGFDINIGGTLWGAPQSFFYPFRGTQYYRDWRYVPDLEPSHEGDYLTDRLTDKAIEVIRLNQDRPFFLNLWYHTVHTPIEGKPEIVARYAQKIRPGANHQNPDYAAMVSSLDENVGRILKVLDDEQLADRTIVVFFSDNGGYINECRLQPGRAVTNNAPLRSGKGSLYEGGIRVPLIIKTPDRAPTGTVCKIPVWSCDLMPTLLDLCGLFNEKDPLPLDGLSLKRLLYEPHAEWEREVLYFHYPHYYPTTTPVSAILVRPWKLLNFFEDNRIELYNLANDPGEKNNLAKQHPEIARKLKAKLQKWLHSVDAPLPEVNPSWKKR